MFERRIGILAALVGAWFLLIVGRLFFMQVVDFAYWREWNMRMLRACDRLAVLMLPGWEESRGVQAEITAAKAWGMPIEYLTPGDL